MSQIYYGIAGINGSSDLFAENLDFLCHLAILSPVCLIVLAPKLESNRVYDGSLVMGNLMLAAYAVGLATCWIHRARETFERPEWRDYLKARGLNGEYEGIGICVLGTFEGDYPPVPPRKPNRIFPDPA